MREECLKWWLDLTFVQKWDEIIRNKSIITGYPDRQPESLTGSEIEKIYDNQL